MTSPASTASSGFAGVLVGTLGTSYIVSMLLRNSIGVIAPDLAAELGLSAAQIGTLSSAFFLSFAVMQIPLGIAIDRYGPKRCMLAGAILSIAAILLFATAITPADLIMARILMGVGMSCYLMAPLALYANRFSADRFAALAGLQIGLGSIGALLATAPLAFAAAVIGWRLSFEVIAAVMAVIGILIAVVVADTSRPSGPDLESLRRSLGGVAAVLRIPGVGRLFFMHMATYSSFALVVGLWGGPYLSHAYGYGLTERGSILLLPAMTQIVGSIAWGASERMFASHKRPALAGGWLTVALLIVIALVGTMP
jgi:MFS family permease